MARKKKDITVRVKVLKIMCGPDGSYKPGDSILIDPDKVDDLVAANAVELDNSEDQAKAVRKVRKRSTKSKAAKSAGEAGEGGEAGEAGGEAGEAGEGGEGGGEAGPRTNKS